MVTSTKSGWIIDMFPNARALQIFARLLGLNGPFLYEPSSALVDAAAADIPVVLSQIESFSYTPHTSSLPADQKIVPAPELIKHLRSRGRVQAAAAWGIFRLLQRAFLGAEVTQIQVPAPNKMYYMKFNENKTLSYCEYPGGSLRVVKSRSFPYYLSTIMCGLPDTAKPPISVAHYSEEEFDQAEDLRLVTVEALMIWSTPSLWDWWLHMPQSLLVCPRFETAPEVEKHRLAFDEATLAIVLDGHPYPNLDPTAFRFFRAIAEASPRIVRTRELQCLSGCKGKRPRDYLKRLPEELRSCIKGRRGGGYYLQLPPEVRA